MNDRIIKKMCAAALAVLMVTGVSAAGIPPIVNANVNVSAINDSPSPWYLMTENNSDGTLTLKSVSGSKLTSITVLAEIKGKKITSIGGEAFKDATQLKSIVLPEGVTTISAEAFKGCASLTSIKLPKSLTSIHDHAFSGCSSLVSVTIPENADLKIWGGVHGNYFYGNVFSGCTKLRNVYVAGNNSKWKSINGVLFKRDQNGDPVTLAYYPAGRTGAYTVPKGTKYLAFNSFSENKNLTVLTLTADVQDLGYENGNSQGGVIVTAFDKISKLIVAKDNPHYSVENGVLFNKDKTSLIMCITEKRGVYKIPDTVKTICQYAFSSQKELTKVVMPKNLTQIGHDAFNGCKNLRSITIPDGVERICQGTFVDCSNLKNITIPENVKIEGINSLYYSNVVFNGCSDDLTIYGKRETDAQNYAHEHYLYFSTKSAPVANTSWLSSDIVIKGRSVKIMLSSADGSGSSKYTVMVKKKTSDKWAVLAKNTKSTSISFTPKTASDYQIRITVTDSSGKSDTVTKSLSAMDNTSKLGAAAAKVGDKVKVRCYAQGGAGEYQYAVYYKKASGKTWYKLRGYKNTNLVLFTPKTAAKYDIKVLAKDSSGIVAAKTLTLKVTK